MDVTLGKYKLKNVVNNENVSVCSRRTHTLADDSLFELFICVYKVTLGYNRNEHFPAQNISPCQNLDEEPLFNNDYNTIKVFNVSQN